MSSKTVILINNVIYMFLLSALMVLVPLFLIHQNISLESIGIILSVLPLTFLVARLVFGSIADEIGFKKIAMIQSISGFLSPVVYMLAATPLIFALGKMIEGVRDSAFWAINRTEIIKAYGIKKAEKSLAMHSAARIFSDAGGRVLIGLSIAFIGFHNSLLGLSLIALIMVMLFSVQKERDRHKLNILNAYRRIARKRSEEFWKVATGLLTLSLSTGLLFVFLIPVYTYEQLKFGFATIGSIMAILSVITAVFIMLPLYFKIRTDILALITILFMGSSLVLFPFADGSLSFWILILIFGIGHGSASILYEEILGNFTKKSKDISTDIGVIHIPLRIGEFLSLFAVGFAISRWGYLPIFAFCAVLVLMFGLFARKYFSDNRHQIG